MHHSNSSDLKGTKNIHFPLGISASYRFDFQDEKYKQIDASISQITDIPMQQFLEKKVTENLIQVIDMAHTETIHQFILQCLSKFKQKKITSNDLINIIYSLMTPSGKRKRIMDQFQFSYIEDGTKIISLGKITDISHFEKEGIPYFFMIRNNMIFDEIKPDIQYIVKESKLPLSKTEFKILEMTAKGMFSKDIAKKLDLNITTLYTHRRNIRKKMNMDINAVLSLLNDKGYIKK